MFVTTMPVIIDAFDYARKGKWLMKTYYVLCLLTLAAVILDVALFHSRSANAQAVPGVRVDRVTFGDTDTGKRSATVPALGHIVGFHCVATDQRVPECFVASSSN